MKLEPYPHEILIINSNNKAEMEQRPKCEGWNYNTIKQKQMSTFLWFGVKQSISKYNTKRLAAKEKKRDKVDFVKIKIFRAANI